MPTDRRRSKRIQEQPKPSTGQRPQRTTRTRSKRNTPIESSSSSEEEQPEPSRILRGTIPILPLDPTSDPAPGEIAPANIIQPISGLVHPALLNAWTINQSVNMCFIFDAVSPARQFKWGALFDEDGTFPDYNDEDPGDVTETDVDLPGLMPFAPREYQRTYGFRCTISAAQFMSWTKNELRQVKLKRLTWAEGSKTPRKTTIGIPAAYHRIVCQLVAEIQLAARTDQHEARRRETYVRQVLDAFGKELEGFTNFTKAAMKRFCSAVLTPILQRQLYGVPEAYTPSVRRAVMRDHSELTIKAAMEFYLGDDPTDPKNIPNYRQNLLYAQEARWHLGRVMKVHINDAKAHVHVEYYNRFLEDHDRIMAGVKDGYEGYHESGCPYLTQAERLAIAREQLTIFFREELAMQPPEPTQSQTQSQ